MNNQDLTKNNQGSNKGDLISREALRKAFHQRIYYFNKSSWDEANALIDSAPTIEEKSYAMGYQDGAEDGLQGLRPTGEWKRDNYGDVFCSNCGVECAYNEEGLYSLGRFCHHCGADMRGKEE